jgi:transcriptional regulator with GAF, ATPase, and Fis domain
LKTRKSAPSDSPSSPTDGDLRAYLVLSHAGRWSDVFQLAPPAEAIIGRASSNEIVIRSERASRQHARIAWSDNEWNIEDLGSRNGTFLNGRPVSERISLSDGDLIEVAGFAITFTHRIQGGLGEAGGATSASRQATDDQLTIEMDAASITDRRRHSSYLHGPGESGGTGLTGHGAGGGVSRGLLQLAFSLARCDKANQAVDAILDAFSQHIAFDTAGAYARASAKPPSSISEIPLLATRQTGSRSYRRPPELLLESVTSEEGQAVLARNIIGDGQLATENSQGVIDVESVIIAPMRDQDGRLRGMVHLTTAVGQTPLGTEDLEFVVAACEIGAESLSNLTDRRSLSRSLRQSQRQVKELQQRLGDKVRIVGRSQPIRDVVKQIGLAAPTHATVLVVGESGVGKELVTAAIHHASDRKNGPLVCMNCAALSPTLLESELFGHEKGAFTGATDRKPGKFESADGGTLMLDEIGEMSAEVQAKFLRVLEGHSFERVGGHQPIKVDVRVVAATNRDLQAMVREGQFRQDLYYRLHVVEIVVPPLRQRGDDCLLLADYFLDNFNKSMGRRIEGFTEAARQRLLHYSWPGNIRELKNVVERAVVLNTGPFIDESDLALSSSAGGEPTGAAEAPVERTLAELEREHIERVLRHTKGNKSRASAILGIERSTLDRKLKKFAS